VVVAAALGVLLTACGDDSDGAGGADLPAVEGPASPRLEVQATEMAYEPDAVAVEAGDVEIVLHNEGSTLHDLRIDDEDAALLVEATPGDTATGTTELDPGSYQFYCSIEGHREAGMEGVLEVR
jgi:plastocyanin